MEYPFKDLLPLDEVLEREGYYKDWTHLDPEVFYSLTQISEYIKTKGYGVDVRLLIAQLAEHFGLKTTQVVDLANLLQQKFENLEGVTQSFTNNINSLVTQMEADKDAVIANATVDSEVILARGGKATLGQRLAQNDQRKETVVYVSDFGALGASNENEVVDETDEIISAFNYARTEGKNKIVFPNNYYLMSKPIPKILMRVEIVGLGNKTKLTYEASEDGPFFETVRQDTVIKGIWLNIKSNGYSTGGILAYNGNMQNWAGRIATENVEIIGYSDYGIRVYSPYETVINKTYVNGYMDIGHPSGNTPPITKAIGIDFLGESIFGNVNTISNSKVHRNRYGVRMVNVGATTIENSTIENNWVQTYGYLPENPPNESVTDKNIVRNTWFENGINDKSRPGGSINVIKKIDDVTGEYVEPLTGSFEITLDNCYVHSSNKIANNTTSVFNYKPHHAMAESKSLTQLMTDNDTIWSAHSNNYGRLVYFKPQLSGVLGRFESSGFNLVDPTNDFAGNEIKEHVRFKPHEATDAPTDGVVRNTLNFDFNPNRIYLIEAYFNIILPENNMLLTKTTTTYHSGRLHGTESEVLVGNKSLAQDFGGGRFGSNLVMVGNKIGYQTWVLQTEKVESTFKITELGRFY